MSTPDLNRLRAVVSAGHLCGPGEAHLFFGPEDEPEPERARRERQAARVCAGCPVAWECHLLAVRSAEWFGVWGGVGPHRRRQVIRQYRRNQPAAEPQPRVCRRGHLVTGNNAGYHGQGYRTCLACRRSRANRTG